MTDTTTDHNTDSVMGYCSNHDRYDCPPPAAEVAAARAFVAAPAPTPAPVRWYNAPVAADMWRADARDRRA
jgi:hypothetical protein